MKLRRIILLFTGTLISAMLGGCTHYFYAPNSHNIPMLKEKNDSRVSAGLGFGDEVSGVELQSSYALSDNVGVMLNGAIGGTEENSGSGRGIEFGWGYYKPLGSRTMFEIYAGTGWGVAENRYDGDRSEIIAKFSRQFIQPSFGYTTKHVEFAVSLRFSRLDYSDLLFKGDINLYRNDHDILIASEKSILLEPAFMFRGGWEYIKFQGQYSLSSNLSNPDLPQENYIFSSSVFVNLNWIFKQ